MRFKERRAAEEFAKQWVDNWNRRDVEAVLAHFSEDIVFTSPRAKAVMGVARIEGKAALREYWMRALAQVQTIHFELGSVIWENERVVILYIAEVNGARMRAAEILLFGSDGLIREGEALHGAVL